ncbi:TPA: hypothetical protein ACQ0F8_001630 [Streptococcus agalactiae]|nr:hypothetical protein [Streptococcus agalactiae]HEO4177362.1 hypothetical protein [Streptococcus agalactiae]
MKNNFLKVGGRKNNMLYILLAVLLIVSCGAGIYAIKKNMQDSTLVKPQSKKQRKVPEGSQESLKPLNDNEKNYLAALSTLELNNKTKIQGSRRNDVVEALEIGAEASKKAGNNLGNMVGTLENRMKMTDNAMIATFAMAFVVNHYELDKENIEVYPSKSDDVVQFIAPLKAKGKNNSYFVGNYNILVNQLQIVSYKGGDIGATFG